jgi:hypothetical protein
MPDLNASKHRRRKKRQKEEKVENPEVFKRCLLEES